MSIRKMSRTAHNLYNQYGVKGLFKGTFNKLTKRDLLEGFTIPYENPLRTVEIATPTSPTLFNALQCLLTSPQKYSDEIKYSCTIVVPIYNGIDHIKRLFPSIVRNTPEYIEVILVNDCSPDSQIKPYINEYLGKYSNWKLVENEKNYGFVKTVNRGMKLVQTEYAILLNTDTMVPKNWIAKMITPFLENERIATTTPFTNSGVYFSFPKFGEDNQINWDLEWVNTAFDHVISNEYGRNEIHSGTGFCMGVNMECWKQIGELDYENFGKGYGEENDWCFRALNKGWRHLLVPNLYVQHFHGGSFLSEEKKKLCEEHAEILEKKYFNIIHDVVPSFQKKDLWKVYRNAAAIQMCAKNAILYVNIKAGADDISGAIDYSNMEIEKLQKNKNSIFIVQYVRRTNNWSIIPYSIDPEMEIPMDDIMDLEFFLEFINVNKVVINNLAFCENAEKAVAVFTKLRKEKEFELIYRFHDYLSICPSFFLIDDTHQPCNPLLGKCKDCIRASQTKAVQWDYIAEWRLTWNAFFDVVDHCVFFSNYTKEIVCKVYPQVTLKSVVKYHQPLIKGNESDFIRSPYIDKWNVAFVGNFCIEKGADYYMKMKEIFTQKNIRASFIIVGDNNSGTQVNDMTVLGRHCREDLGKILSENQIHFVLYPSINNETFSYVTQELMMLNVPFVVFPCGAPQERIKKEHYRLGKIAKNVSLESLYEATEKLIKDVYHRSLC